MEPDKLQDICRQVRVASPFSTLHDAINSNRMSDERQELTKMRVVLIVIYIMMYSQLQRAGAA